jgi:ATP-dependent Lon protease
VEIVATGMAWTPAGGDILFVEATMMPGQKSLVLTGQLGDVMKESAQAALSYVRSKAKNLGISEDFFSGHDLHIHVPAGAIPKDGPSAGVTILTALASLLTCRPIKSDVAMTGEVTLRGTVLPVGGIKEKVLAASRSGIKHIILPERNRNDLEEIPEKIKDGLQFHLVKKIDEVLDIALDTPIGPSCN